MTRRNYELNMIDEQNSKDYSNAELKKTFYTLTYPKNCPTNGGKLRGQAKVYGNIRNVFAFLAILPVVYSLQPEHPMGC